MDRIRKALSKLSPKERATLKSMLERIAVGSFAGMDIKRLRANDGVFRVRKGDMRIIFRRRNDGIVDILALERRSDTTYDAY